MQKTPDIDRLLFSVTADDCEWKYSRGSGKGGQKRNKTESRVQCTHKASGARGESDDSRSQHDNKRTAFLRMTKTKEFTEWHRLEVARHMGEATRIEDSVEEAMRAHNLKTEVFREGKWQDYHSESNEQESA